MGESYCDGDHVYSLGHSEGTVIVSQLAFEVPELAGVILLCPFVQLLEQVLRNQAIQVKTDLVDLFGFGRSKNAVKSIQ
jgi:alpha-beta hydrolase superfamily lysophospholipase